MTLLVATPLVNLGCGNYPLPGWTNVDAYTDADIQGDLFELDFAEVKQVRMTHLLEHLPWRRAQEALQRVHSWMAADGVLFVETPDMEAIMLRGVVHPLWFKYVYGDQSHEGEYHRSGWTSEMLWEMLKASGWTPRRVRTFESDHKGREGMPCVEAVAVA